MTGIDDIEASKAPLMDHIIELRNRLMYSVAALVVAFIGCYLVAEHIYAFLMQPLVAALGDQEGRRMIFTALHEAFFTYIKVAFWAACFVSFPVVASQIYMFVAPGLYKNEKRAFLPFLVVTPFLFFAGGAMVYYLIMPLAWQFFLGFEAPGGEGSLAIVLEPKVNEYLALVMKLIFAFGLCFQLPVLLTLLARVGIATSEGLRKKRKYAIVMVFVVAAVLTPPDPISQVSLAVPILVLYEVSIYCAKLVEKKRAEREAAEDAAD
ncbi:MAG: twin-arginine translocase subunit TatC [Minwuiales bacterium]|nr:twin-arginine translocase subunit TatC [Minwuiales bacterium]